LLAPVNVDALENAEPVEPLLRFENRGVAEGLAFFSSAVRRMTCAGEVLPRTTTSRG